MYTIPGRGPSEQGQSVDSIVFHHEIARFPIGQRVTDGYINATVLCQACGKLLGNYLQIGATKDFMASLSKSIGIPIDLLVQKNMTGPNNQRGTWVHPYVAVNLAQWCSSDFAVLVSRWVIEWASTGRISPRPTRQPVYTTRLVLAFKMMVGVPEGFWTVFDKCSNLLILVECELKLPVDHYDLLDGSVGIRWSRHRKGKPWAGQPVRYPHTFPDNRGVRKAWAYPLDELAHFERWLRGVYIPTHLPNYLEKKYSLSVPAKQLIDNVLAGRKMIAG